MKKILPLSIGILSLVIISNAFATRRWQESIFSQKQSTTITSCDDIMAMNGKWIGVTGGLSTTLKVDLEFASPDSYANSYGTYSYFNGAFAGTLQPLDCTQNSDNTLTITGDGADAHLILLLNSSNSALTLQPGSTLHNRTHNAIGITGVLKLS